MAISAMGEIIPCNVEEDLRAGFIITDEDDGWQRVKKIGYLQSKVGIWIFDSF